LLSIDSSPVYGMERIICWRRNICVAVSGRWYG